jgi:hypothetical protein
MKATRVLVANELRSYRETIARVITGLRPDVEVHEVEPEDLDAKVARLRPDLVICSRVTSTVESCVPVWAELYPDHKVRVLASGSCAVERLLCTATLHKK